MYESQGYSKFYQKWYDDIVSAELADGWSDEDAEACAAEAIEEAIYWGRVDEGYWGRVDEGRQRAKDRVIDGN